MVLRYEKFAARVIYGPLQEPPSGHVQYGVTYFPHDFVNESARHWVPVSCKCENSGNEGAASDD